MTIEELLECSADKLEKMTTEQLLSWFGPKLKITRPELARQERRASKPNRQLSMESLSPEEQIKRNKVRDILADLGMAADDIDDIA
jgi:hypothetical protein